MAKRLILRKGDTSDHGSFTGAAAEVTVNTETKTAVVHDGSTAGGFPLLRADVNNLANDAVSLDKVNGGTLGTGAIGASVTGGAGLMPTGVTSLGTVTSGTIGAEDSSAVNQIMARNEGLHLRVVNTNTFDFNADKLTLFDASGYGVVLDTVYKEISMTVSGNGGIDTGSQASDWYHVWAIWNGSTFGGVASLSATAPTMPAGYTYKKYVGAVHNSGSDLLSQKQYGNVVGRTMSTVISGGNATSWSSVSPAVPTTAKMGLYYIAITQPGGNTSMHAYFSSNGTAPWSQLTLRWTGAGVMNDFSGWIRLPITTAQTLWYYSSHTDTDITISNVGWEYPDIV